MNNLVYIVVTNDYGPELIGPFEEDAADELASRINDENEDVVAQVLHPSHPSESDWSKRSVLR